jgi:hypothetical protein
MRVLVVVTLAALVVLPAACSSNCVSGQQQSVPVCDSTSGTASVSSAPALALSGTPRVANGQSCLAADGSCNDHPSFELTTYQGTASASDDFFIAVTLPTGGGSRSFTLPSSDASAGGTIGTAHATIAATGGLIDVTTSTTAALVADYTLQYTAPEGTAFTVAGHVDVGGCHRNSQCSF